jgi:hypothetical protein
MLDASVEQRVHVSDADSHQYRRTVRRIHTPNTHALATADGYYDRRRRPIDRVPGTYYLLRNTVVIPRSAIGGALWEFGSPAVAFTVAAAIGVVGTGYFLRFGQEFDAYR